MCVCSSSQVTKSISDSTVTSPVITPQSTSHDLLLDSSFVSEQPPVGDTPSHVIPETHSAFHTPSLSGSSSTHLLVSSSVNQDSIPDSIPKTQNADSNFAPETQTLNSSSADQGLASLVAQEPYYPESSSSNSVQTNTKDTNCAPHQKQQQQNQPRSDTFFSKLPHKFTDVLLLADNGIPTDQFLKACEDTLPFFSKHSAIVLLYTYACIVIV